MNQFVRFIFFLVAIGAAINLTIVIAANYMTDRTQRRLLDEERKALAAHYQTLAQHPGEAHLAVEWQKVGERGGERNKVLETSVLLRNYGRDAHGKTVPAPIRRLLFPGDRITIEGIEISFLETFKPEFAFTRNRSVRVLTFIYSDEQARLRDELFRKARTRVYEAWEVPQAVRLNVTQPTQIERRIWQIVGEAANHVLNNSDLTAHQREGVRVSRLGSDSVTLTNGALYRVVATETGIGISPASDDAVLRAMRQEAERLPAAPAQGAP